MAINTCGQRMFHHRPFVTVSHEQVPDFGIAWKWTPTRGTAQDVRTTSME